MSFMAGSAYDGMMTTQDNVKTKISQNFNVFLIKYYLINTQKSFSFFSK